MADNEIKIRLSAKTDEAKKAKQALADLSKEIKAVELAFKSGHLAGGQAQIMFGDIARRVKQLGVDELDLVNISTQLWHAQNRVTLGFKSLATEVTGIHNKMRPASEQLREFYREQRVGDRTMREVSSTVGMFSRIMGRDVTNAVDNAFSAFQQSEFAIEGLSIAAQNASTKFQGMAAAIMSAKAGIVALVSVGVAEILILQDLLDKLDAAAKRFRKARGLPEKMPEPSLWMKFLSSLGGVANAPIQLMSSMAKTTINLEREAFELENKREDKGKKLADIAKKNIELAEKQLRAGDVGIGQVIETIKLEARHLTTLEDQLDVKIKIRQLEKEAAELAKKSKDKTTRAPTRNLEIAHMEPVGLDLARLRKIDKRKLRIEDELLPRELRALDLKEEFKEAEKEASDFEHAAVGALHNVGRTIANSIGQGFVDAFGIGHTLLGQFVNEFISSLISLSISRIIPGLGFAAGGTIYEPIVGRGLSSGHVYSFGERGPERITPMGSYARDAGRQIGGNITVVVRGDFRYDRLAFAIDRGNQQRSIRRMHLTTL